MTIPFWCVLIAYVLIFVPRAAVVKAIVDMGEGYDNNDPAQQKAKLEGWGRRAEAAHRNAFESFMPFTAGVVIAHLSGGDPEWAARLALIHVTARLIYPFLYIAGRGTSRTAVWTVGTAASVGLMTLGAWS